MSSINIRPEIIEMQNTEVQNLNKRNITVVTRFPSAFILQSVHLTTIPLYWVTAWHLISFLFIYVYFDRIFTLPITTMLLLIIS